MAISGEQYFRTDRIVQVGAASIGVSKDRWVAIAAAGASERAALAIMRSGHFDILPIVSGGAVDGYYQTPAWGDVSSAQRKTLASHDSLSVYASLPELIERFVSERRSFYFLADGAEIAGLVTVANLNSRLVKVYLFDLLCELEIRLANFIGFRITEAAFDEDVDVWLPRNDDDILRNRDLDLLNGVDVHYTEYLFLSDMAQLIKIHALYEAIGYASRRDFSDAFLDINALRNKVCHARSLITAAYGVADLLRDIRAINQALSGLSGYQEA